MHHLSGDAASVLLGGMILSLVGWIWLVVVGFRIGVLWGLSTLICPTFAAPCFALDHWKKTRIPLAIHLAGMLMILFFRLKYD
jgi:hypothetical protein